MKNKKAVGMGIPEIVEVPGSRVEDNALGMTYFDENRITIPAFDDAIAKVGKKNKGFLRRVAKGFQRYILGHELEVEYAGRPRTEEDHARLEARMLYRMRENLYRSPTTANAFQYASAVTTHYLRGKRDDFRRRVSRYFDVDEEKGFIDSLLEKASEGLSGAFDVGMERLLGVSEKPLPAYAQAYALED
ncbi:MAG: hypothetical protein HY367_02790 [Candidatus Aenigmarchaeota archaeon]|nr:hypothetical protein [Candidatus Aenigmarchaeota archaeon]